MAIHEELPFGWSERLNDSGRYYYYNEKTKETTYERPLVNKTHKKRKRRADYAKFKIPLSDSWILVFLKSGKRFVHNIQTKQSLWIAPDNVQREIDSLDRDQLILLIAKARGLKLEEEREHEGKEEEEPNASSEVVQSLGTTIGDQSVTPMIHLKDDKVQGPELEEMQDEETWEPLEEPDEFEDDYSSSESGSLDNGSTNEQNLDFEEDELAELSEEQKLSTFHDMLNSHNIDPYKPWDSELNRVIDDSRYDVFDTNKQRSEAFDTWAKQKIAQMKQASAVALNNSVESSSQFATPISSFMSYLKSNFNKRLLYIEFKRKFRKDLQFSNSDLADKDKEKLYREFSNWMKKSDEERELALKELSSKIDWKDVLNEPIYYTVSPEVAEKVRGSTLKKFTPAQEGGIKKRQQEVEKQKQKRLQELRRERHLLQKENEKVVQATYDIDTKSSLRDHLMK
jgi:hypothetical protein